MATTKPVDPLEQILYAKNQYAQGASTGNKGLQTWAAAQAKQQYGTLDKAEAAKVSEMGSSQLSEYIKAKNGEVYGNTTTPTNGAASGDGVHTNPTAGQGVEGLPPGYGPAKMMGSSGAGQQFPIDKKYGFDPSAEAAQGQQMSATDMMLQQFLSIMSGNALDQAALKKQADEQAALQANEQKSSYQRLIDSLVGNQSADLQSINSGVAQSKSDLEDKSFQNFLQARQAMANRGLAGSGLASDQDTRLLLANGRELAGIGRDAESKIAGTRANYSGKLADANSQLAGVNQNAMAQQIFNELYKNGTAALNDKAKIYTDLIGKTIGYDKLSASDAANMQFNYDKLDTEGQQFYDKLGADQQSDYAKMNQSDRQFYAGLDNSNRQFYDKLDSEQRQVAAKISADYDIDLMKVMGVDSQGRPTLDRDKLAEEVRKNKASEGFDYDKLTAEMTDWTAKNQIAGDRVALGYAQLTEKSKYDSAMIDKAVASASNATDRLVLSGYQTQLNALKPILEAKAKNLKPGETLDPNKDKDMKAYNDILSKVSGVINPKGNNSGSDTSTSNSGSGSYSNFYKSAKFNPSSPEVQKASSSINNALQAKSLPQSWLKPLMELVARESSFNPDAKNDKSSAAGYFQFLDGTRKNYGGDKVNWNDPQQQALAGVQYVIDRYGTPEKALAFWDKHNWY